MQLGGLGGARRGQVESGGARRCQEDPGGARRSQEEEEEEEEDAKGCQGRPWQQEYYISCRTERQPRCSLRLIVLRGSTQACPHKRVREIAEPDHL